MAKVDGTLLSIAPVYDDLLIANTGIAEGLERAQNATQRADIDEIFADFRKFITEHGLQSPRPDSVPPGQTERTEQLTNRQGEQA